MTTFATSNIAGVNVTQVFSNPDLASDGYNQFVGGIPFALGTVCWGSDGSSWVFVKYDTGGGTIGYAVKIDEDWLATMMTTSNASFGDLVGIVGGTATVGQYGWVQRFGVSDGIYAGANCNANVQLATTATDGELDDTVTGGTKNISGIVLTTGPGGSAALAPGVLNWPVVTTTN